MAKGDDARLRNAIDYSTGFAQNRLDNTQRILDRQNLGFEQNYNRAASTNFNDYNSIMGQYRQFLSGGPMGGTQPTGGGNVPQQGAGNVPPATQPGQSLVGGPHATNPNNAPAIGTAVPRGQVGPGPGQQGAPGTPDNTQPNADQLATQRPGSAEQFIANYQREHPGEVSKQGVLSALQNAGYDAKEYMYGNTPSGNEISLNGQKYKVIGGENSSNPFWYAAGTDDSPPGSIPGAGPNGIMNPLAGYSWFGQTGGFSPRDIQNIRAQSIAPIRGLVSSAMQEVQRQGRMGNAPNKVAALAKIAREGAYETADATTNAEANIARLVQSGRLAGLGGLQSGILGANQGMTSLYGSTPGMASTFGNQVLSSTNQQLYANQLENDIQKMRLNAQAELLRAPGTTQSAMANIGSVADTVGKIATAGSGLGGLNPFGRRGRDYPGGE